MIEEIKKEIEENSTIHSVAIDDNGNHDLFLHIRLGIFESILDKYKDKEPIDTQGYEMYIIELLKYKKCWEELKGIVIDKGSNGYDDSATMEDYFGGTFKELEVKNGI